MYYKEIIYMGLHKDGSRVGSAGFLKAEKRDKTSMLTMTVKNLPFSIDGRFPVRYCLGEDDAEQPDRMDWKEEDGITLRDGGGVWEKEEEKVSERIYVQIILPNGYLVEGKSKAALSHTSSKAKIPHELAAAPLVESAPAGWEEPAAGSAAVAARESAPAGWEEPAAGSAAVAARESAPVGWEEPAAGSAAVAARESAPVEGEEPAVSATSQKVMPKRPPLMADALAIEGLKEDKWEQILDTYEQIHPYGDGRVYVKIAPKDFIILSGNCQHLVNNSFLLHGYYNYRYVILGRGYSVSSPEKEDYLLGVPGVFYEREKMVALMFGFEAFECEGGDPKPGDFGYYLRKVEL